METPPTELTGVLETPLCYDHAQREETLAFYENTLGLRKVAQWEDGTAFRMGHGVVLLFDRDLLAQNDSPVAQHGTQGHGHACFLAAPDHYESVRERLRDEGVEITHEHDWSGGRESFYFRDPAGNLLEIASGDIWPT